MTLEQQIQWVGKQMEYSKILEDGDEAKWKDVLVSLQQLKELVYLELMKTALKGE